MSEKSEKDRRQSPRVKFSGITLVSVGDDQLHCIAGDLSESGILIFPQQLVKVLSGRILRLTFTLPGIMRWIMLDGMLVRQARFRSRIAWGVQFDVVPEEIKGHLKEFVRQWSPRFRSEPPPPAIAVPRPVEVVSALEGGGKIISASKPTLVVLRDDDGLQQWDDDTPSVPASTIEPYLAQTAEDAWQEIDGHFRELTRQVSATELATTLELERDEATTALPRSDTPKPEPKR